MADAAQQQAGTHLSLLTMAIRVRTSSGSLLCCFLGAMPLAGGYARPQLRPPGRRALVLCQTQEVRQCPEAFHF